jgi:hypothetical protein
MDVLREGGPRVVQPLDPTLGERFVEPVEEVMD